jgi:uncharacterized flavoprotein (TIGR03862 family)
MSKQSIVIIGGGASALALACSINTTQYDVTIVEQNAALGRKFLVAGKGGFNLTHSEIISAFVTRYTPQAFIQPFLAHYNNTQFIAWLASIGITTYTGTSKRMFPTKGTKPIQVLQAIERCIIANKVAVIYNTTWKGWDSSNALILHNKQGQTSVIKPTITVFAMGGASWKVTGSNGLWAQAFVYKGISVSSFYPSNCAYKIKWDTTFATTIAGGVLKNTLFTCGTISKMGEAVLTNFGIEGSGIYALSSAIRQQLLHTKKAVIYLDFKPTTSSDAIIDALTNRGKLSIKDVLIKQLNIGNAALLLIQNYTTKVQYNSHKDLAMNIKKFTLTINDFGAIDEAISTVGGIELNEVDNELQLKKLPNTYVIGEMLNWDAPTGGYLLQACFSMGNYVANVLNNTIP